MTYAANETSNQASPIELYHFARGLDNWRYTSYDELISFQSADYEPLALGRSDIEWQSEIERSEITITLPRDNLLAAQYIAYPPTEVLTLTIYRQHAYDVSGEYSVYWQGRLLNTEFKGSVCEFTCETVYTSLKRPGLRRKALPQCPHVLYGPQCRANQETYRSIGTLSAIGSFTLTAPEWGGFSDGYFTGGLIIYDTFQRREIMDHVGSTITISANLLDVQLGATVSAFPGCAHNMDDCVNKFTNEENYGGFPYFGPNPFGGRTIF